VKISIFIILTLTLAMTAILGCKKKEVVVEEIEPEQEQRLVFRLPEPERVLFYRDGTTVYEAKIPTDAIINNSFILPPQIDKNSFTIFQNSERIFSYSLIEGQVFVQLLEEDPVNPEVPLIRPSQMLLVTVPELEPDSPLIVKFGIGRSGISWKLVLDMEAAENNSLNCNLLAAIEVSNTLTGNLEYILAKRPEISLISSNNIFLEGSDAVFNLGNPLIQLEKTTFMKLEEGKSSYRLVYVWDAENKDSPDAYLYCSNPFKSSISGVQGNLNSNGLNINTFSSVRLIPGRQFQLLVGNQPLISTFKAARIQEFSKEEYPNRVNLPFTHSLEYRATNNLGVAAELEISVPVFYGRVHRTQYNFRRQPDERPGDRMIWKYRLPPNTNASLEFSFDAERKDNSRYSDYDHYSNGR
jgi:hypothetical protein